MTTPCSMSVEDVWGPQVHGCGTDFDLTLLFQEVVLFIGPLGIATVLAGYRIWQLLKTEAIIASPILHGLKLGGLLAAQASINASRTRASIAVSSVGIVGYLFLLITSHLEHARAVRASTVMLLYLSYSTPADTMRTRTLWSMPRENQPVAAILACSCVCKFVLLILESRPKVVRPKVQTPTADERANIVSQAFIWWLVPLFVRARKSALTMALLPEIDPKLTRAVDEGNDVLCGQSVFQHLLIVRGRLLASAIFPQLCYTGLLYAQPFLVQRATEFMTAPRGVNTNKIGGGLIAAYAIVYVGIAATQVIYRQCTARAITAIRADLVTMIHNHTLRLSSSSSSRDAASTLMSADVERFAAGSRNMHECWACVIQVALGVWLLERQLGWAVAATTGLTVTFLGVTALVLTPAGKRQTAWLKSMETRIAATTQSLRVIKGIKMTGLAATIHRNLTRLRKAEARSVRRFRYVLLVVAWASFIPVIMSPVLGFTIYNVAIGPQSGRILTPAMVYPSLTIFVLFGNSVAQLIESAVNLWTAAAALRRIQEFLVDDNTYRDKRVLLSSIDVNADDNELPSAALGRRRNPIALRLTQVDAGWIADQPMIINNVNLNASSPSIVAVVGPTGCGKTTLIQVLLGESQYTGSVAISTRRIGYCSQTPWLSNDSIRNNIVGPETFDQGWYDTVIRATALQQDLTTMAEGDSTMVGYDGSALSGGQKKRVALARAVYMRAPMMFLDDPFNGLDGRTETYVIEALLGPAGLLRQKGNDYMIMIVGGESETEADCELVRQVRVADRVVSLTDTANSEDEFQTSGFHSRSFKDVRGAIQGSLSGHSSSKDGTQEPTTTTNSSVYRYYLKVAGKRKLMVFLGMCMVFVAGVAFNQIWIVLWSEHNVSDYRTAQGLYIGLYFGIGAVQLIAWTGAAFFFVIAIAEKSADRCHTALLETVLCAPMSFFDSTAAGNIINRFSQDLQLIDTELPYSFIGAVNQFLAAIGNCCIIIYGSPWAGLAIPVVGATLYMLQGFYLSSSRQLRLLEIEAKGPLFSNFLETLNGLATIRALRWNAEYMRKNQVAIKDSQKPFYLLYASQNWLNLTLDLITAGLAVIIMCIGVATAGSAAGATIGLALFSAAGFGASAKDVIQHWTQLEISMSAIERVRSFTKETPSEVEKSVLRAALAGDYKAWQGRGIIKFDKVSARYTPSSPLVLRDISIEIQPGQRYAICGRTGSGKSTLIATLLRLIPVDGGTIYVDESDISKLRPDQVRSRFNTLPQDPVLIYGTVRHNMQLYEPSCNDRDMIAALDAFGLWDTILSKGGLDVPLNDELLSHGQRQLLCFARSTLQKSNIIILDEPSSQSDRDIEQMMERSIRERFKGHTVLCIAHKLATILSFDTVITMDAGSIAETGNPRMLLQDQTSLFSKLMLSQRDHVENP
ncbi:ABC transporter [Xylariales sp. PMI_506]|nr:ABC transporter [Xylariales sp. PMI_506]